MPYDLTVLLGSSRISVVEPQGQACNLIKCTLNLTAKEETSLLLYDGDPRYVPAPQPQEIYNSEIFSLRIYVDRSQKMPCHVSFGSRPVGHLAELHVDLTPEKHIIQFRFDKPQPDILVDGLVALGASVDMPGEA